ncbi:MAG: hypothetical protein NVSMB51_12620 [Solirubrobacteraceae bacterium]
MLVVLLVGAAPAGALEYNGEGVGSATPPYPAAARVTSAAHFLAARRGRTAFALVDSRGGISGAHMHRTFVSASVVKAMLLVGLLRELPTLDASSRAILYPMIHVSDNNAATAVYGRLGDAGLYAVARAAHMQEFSVHGFWANAQLSPFDQARFFYNQEALIPPRYRAYARYLLSGIDSSQSWGLPQVARRGGWRVFFKGGWRGTGLGQLVHQAARLQRDGRQLAIAVMTDGDPSMGYGESTIAGVTARLLG